MIRLCCQSEPRRTLLKIAAGIKKIKKIYSRAAQPAAKKIKKIKFFI